MANIKISELNPLLTVADADVLPIVNNGVTKKVTASVLQSYTQGNSVLLTGAQSIAGVKTFVNQLVSSVATGTAPFSVASTTKVTNLNADLLDGLSSADFQSTLNGTGIVKSTSGTISYLTDNSSNWDSAYNDKINSASVTGTGTNTLTLTQQDAGTITATWVNGTLIREIRNSTGATLTKGTIVYISGATGNKPTVSKAIATGDSTSAQTFGFIQSDLANNANGYVVIVGDLTGVDTSAFAEGAQLYLSSTVAGAFTDVKQYAPNHLVYVGIVTRAHPTLGQIEVNISNGFEMDELHNVAAQSPSNGDILQYVTSTGLWTKIAGTTSAISEGSNLYYTEARVNANTNVAANTAARHNAVTLGTANGLSLSTQALSLALASGSTTGALSSTDFATFNAKQNAITLTTTGTSGAATLVGATLNIPQYQSVLTNPITGTGTTNFLPKFTGASALGNSILQEGTTTIGLNVAPSAWSGFGALQTVGGSVIGAAGQLDFWQNAYFDGASKYYATGTATRYGMTAGQHRWYNAISGSANAALTWVQAMTLTESGKLGIATTTPSGNLGIGVQTGLITTTGITLGTANANIEFIGSNLGSGYGAKIYQNGERALSIAGRAGTTVWSDHFTVLDTGNVGIGTIAPTFKLEVNGNAKVGTSLTIGTGISLSNSTAPASGIQFPATQVASASANNLDDYEEGTWTMGIAFGGASVGVTYSLNTGTYTKVGRQVTVTGYMLLTNKGTSVGNASITGLPFTSGSTASFFGVPSLFLTSTTFTNQYTGLLLNNSTSFNVNQVTNLGVATNLTNVNFANNSEIIVTLTYFV